MNYVFRALPLKRDARTFRYKSYLPGETILDTWEETYNEYIGLKKLKRGRKELCFIFSYPLYLIYLFLFSLIHIKSNDRIICMDIDVFIPIYLASFWKSSKIYLDIVDPVSQTKFRRMPINKIFDYSEYFFLRVRRYNIVPNFNRIEYYQDRLSLKITHLNYLVVENVPQLLSNNYLADEVLIRYDIGYFGTLDESRGILELIEFCKESDLSLLIAGTGALENKIKTNLNSDGYEKIKFYGSFSSNELEILYNSVKFSWAYYTDKIFLHKYASPNKYYEHLAFKTPIIINEFVPLSNIVEQMRTGIIINDNLNEKTFKILNIALKEFNYDEGTYDIWNDKYQHYAVDFDEYEKTKRV